jgi:hypothetical protein
MDRRADDRFQREVLEKLSQIHSDVAVAVAEHRNLKESVTELKKDIKWADTKHWIVSVCVMPIVMALHLGVRKMGLDI